MSQKKVCVGDYSIVVKLKCETNGSCGCPTLRKFNGGGTTKRKTICKKNKCCNIKCPRGPR